MVVLAMVVLAEVVLAEVVLAVAETEAAPEPAAVMAAERAVGAHCHFHYLRLGSVSVPDFADCCCCYCSFRCCCFYYRCLQHLHL